VGPSTLRKLADVLRTVPNLFPVPPLPERLAAQVIIGLAAVRGGGALPEQALKGPRPLARPLPRRLVGLLLGVPRQAEQPAIQRLDLLLPLVDRRGRAVKPVAGDSEIASARLALAGRAVVQLPPVLLAVVV